MLKGLEGVFFQIESVFGTADVTDCYILFVLPVVALQLARGLRLDIVIWSGIIWGWSIEGQAGGC
jgi:hypothetical protein